MANINYWDQYLLASLKSDKKLKIFWNYRFGIFEGEVIFMKKLEKWQNQRILVTWSFRDGCQKIKIIESIWRRKKYFNLNFYYINGELLYFINV